MKYYDVKNGRIPGIYTAWEKCKAQVDKYPKAEYKSFLSLQEAEEYLFSQKQVAENKISEIETPYAFIDGSFNTKTQTYGYGGFLVDANNEMHTLQGSSKDPYIAFMRNVAGEIQGAIAAVQKALELHLDVLNIYYDYAGIENWVTGSWRCMNKNTQGYRDFMRNAGIKINFIKVPAHKGIPGNEVADRLAKEAVGIST